MVLWSKTSQQLWRKLSRWILSSDHNGKPTELLRRCQHGLSLFLCQCLCASFGFLPLASHSFVTCLPLSAWVFLSLKTFVLHQQETATAPRHGRALWIMLLRTYLYLFATQTRRNASASSGRLIVLPWHPRESVQESGECTGSCWKMYPKL